jgi:hypothetical protein
MDASESTARSLAAVNGFKGQVERYGLWSGAWVGVVAIRQGDEWILFLFRSQLNTPGARIPAPSKVFDAIASEVIVRVRQVTLDDFWHILEELAGGDTTTLSGVVGQQVHLHSAKNPTVWSNPSTYSRNERTHLQTSR